MQASPARRVRKVIPALKACQETLVARLDLKAFKVMMGLKAYLEFKALREMMARPEPKVQSVLPDPKGRWETKVRKECREIQVARLDPKVLKATTEFKVRPAR